MSGGARDLLDRWRGQLREPGHHTRKAHFYAFDAIEDQQVAKVLFEAVFDWAHGRGLDTVIGEGTKIAQFLNAADKSYVAQVRLGSTTTTGDPTGDVRTTAAVRP